MSTLRTNPRRPYADTITEREMALLEKRAYNAKFADCWPCRVIEHRDSGRTVVEFPDNCRVVVATRLVTEAPA